MTSLKIGIADKAIEAEFERLFEAYFETGDGDADFDITDYERYLRTHASPAALKTMDEIAEAHRDAEQRGVYI